MSFEPEHIECLNCPFQIPGDGELFIAGCRALEDKIEPPAFCPENTEGRGDKRMEHTPTPWFIIKAKLAGPKAENDRLIHTADGKHIAEVFQYQNEKNQDGPAEANAEFIVHACNSHYDLLKICKDIKRCNTRGQQITERIRVGLSKAIAKAERRRKS